MKTRAQSNLKNNVWYKKTGSNTLIVVIGFLIGGIVFLFFPPTGYIGASVCFIISILSFFSATDGVEINKGKGYVCDIKASGLKDKYDLQDFFKVSVVSKPSDKGSPGINVILESSKDNPYIIERFPWPGEDDKYEAKRMAIEISTYLNLPLSIGEDIEINK